MKALQLKVAATCLVMAVAACQKDAKRPGNTQQPFSPDIEKSENPVATNVFNVYRAQNTETFVFSGKQGTSVTTNDGIKIVVTPSTLRRPDGTVESGPVTMRAFGIMNVTDQALGGAPTQTLPGDNSTLATGGAIDLRMTNAQGQQLRSQGTGVTVEIPTAAFDPTMTLWDGVPAPAQPDVNVWQPSSEPVTPGSGGTTFKFNWTRSGQFNIDKINGCPGVRSGYQVKVAGPPAFNNTNTVVYGVVKACSIPTLSVVFSLDMYNAVPQYWFANPGLNLINGTNVTFVAVSSVGGQLYYGFTTATAGPGMVANITNMTPTTMPALMAYLATL